MDDEATFFLGKMDLSYLWLQLATLDRKTGWSEYWEAKKLLEAILEKDPMHVRARVARAWMDYIVGTRVPWGTRWVMGGGSKSRGLKMVREAAQTPAGVYTQVEAQFGLWEMLTRDGRRDEGGVGVGGQGRQALDLQEMVERGDQVGRGVDERAVQVESDDGPVEAVR